jgi:hypothetical protein
MYAVTQMPVKQFAALKMGSGSIVRSNLE